MHALGEGLKLSEHFLEGGALGLGLGQRGYLLVQLRQPLPRLAQTRLEFLLPHQPFLIGVQQPRDALLHPLPQGPRRLRGTLPRRLGLRQTPLVFLLQAHRLTEQRANILPYHFLQELGADRPARADPLSAPAMRIQAGAAVVIARAGAVLSPPAAAMIAQGVTAVLTDHEPLQQPARAAGP